MLTFSKGTQGVFTFMLGKQWRACPPLYSWRGICTKRATSLDVNVMALKLKQVIVSFSIQCATVQNQNKTCTACELCMKSQSPLWPCTTASYLYFVIFLGHAVWCRPPSVSALCLPTSYLLFIHFSLSHSVVGPSRDGSVAIDRTNEHPLSLLYCFNGKRCDHHLCDHLNVVSNKHTLHEEGKDKIM